MNDFTVQQGWQCPICKRVYSPLTMMCYYCGGDTVTRTGTFSETGDTDWMKQRTITVSNNKVVENFTSISNGRDTFTATAHDMGTCDNCKNNTGLPHNNGTKEYSGKCASCIGKSNWENAQ